MQVVNRKREIGYEPSLVGAAADMASLVKVTEDNKKASYLLKVPKSASTQGSLIVKFKLKAIGVKGSWTSNAILDKRFRTDWEMPQVSSSISVDAPLISLYGYEDENIMTLACSDAVSDLKFEASLREEDNHFYCSIHFFTQDVLTEDYSAEILVDQSADNFSSVIQSSMNWVLAKSNLEQTAIPDRAAVPLYSTWYSFHQDLDEAKLLEECSLSKAIGYELIIIDDGWQTMDDNRGYDYTGDWRPERIPNTANFVQKVHDLGMAIMFWYSVPFCGKKSDAYKKFKGKFLTENHHWAPVFDPRFPEVRSYLVDIYCSALIDWNLDGFKLDFIDDFRVYPETETKELQGRDTLSVPEGTDRLIREISQALAAIKPDVLVEFRQKYISPALHKLGNMFRAFDCPNDSLMNRVRTTDVKLICGQAAVHSDMITWHKEEPVEIAALQFSSLLFSVPQLSVRLADRSLEEIQMIEFYTQYWIKHKATLLGGKFTAYKPLANYPILSAKKDDFCIVGLYEDVILPLEEFDFSELHIVNGKTSDSVIIKLDKELKCKMHTTDCRGNKTVEVDQHFTKGVHLVLCPPNGIIYLKS